MTFRIIHSGRCPERRNASTTFRRLAALRRLRADVSVFMTRRSSSARSSMLTLWRSSWIASAPILATNASPPYLTLSSRNLSSVMRLLISRFSSSESGPGSMTTYCSK